MKLKIVILAAFCLLAGFSDAQQRRRKGKKAGADAGKGDFKLKSLEPIDEALSMV